MKRHIMFLLAILVILVTLVFPGCSKETASPQISPQISPQVSQSAALLGGIWGPDGSSPALRGTGDILEPGIQGMVPAGATANYNCGLTLLGKIDGIQGGITGVLQGAGNYAYVRISTGTYPNFITSIIVIDVTNPANPVKIGNVSHFGRGTETMRAVVTDKRAVLVSGRNVYDISNPANPVLKGQILWPTLTLYGIDVGQCPHDIRVNHAGTKVYSSFGIFEADISDLEHPESWKVKCYTCALGAQFWPADQQAATGNIDLCSRFLANATVPMAVDGPQAALLYPAIGHGPDLNGDDTRLYMAPVGGGLQERMFLPALSIIDVTQNPPKIIDQTLGTGYVINWFQTADGKEFLLRTGEGYSGIGPMPNDQRIVPGNSSVPENKRPERLGWAYEAYVTEVTNDMATPRSILQVAINNSKFYEAYVASGRYPMVHCTIVDDPYNATFAVLSYGDAGLRVFDIRNPNKPVEVAYFNHGSVQGLTHYDASRGLIYIIDAGGFKVLQIQDQVLKYLGLD